MTVIAKVDLVKKQSSPDCGITPFKFLENALSHVENNSIREWVKTEHNYPIWLKLAQHAIDNSKLEVSNFAAYIVCVAMGM